MKTTLTILLAVILLSGCKKDAPIEQTIIDSLDIFY